MGPKIKGKLHRLHLLQLQLADSKQTLTCGLLASLQDRAKHRLCQSQAQNSIFCFQFSYLFSFYLQPRIQKENLSMQHLPAHTEILWMNRVQERIETLSARRRSGCADSFTYCRDETSWPKQGLAWYPPTSRGSKPLSAPAPRTTRDAGLRLQTLSFGQ